MTKIFVLALFLHSLIFLNLHSQPGPSGSESFGDRLIVGKVGQAPEYLNPFRIDDLVEKEISRLIFGNGLLQQYDRFGNYQPLVDRFKYVDENGQRGKVWQYVLKRNITFQNGMPLRNYDVQFTFDLLQIWGGYILNRKIDFSNIQSIELNGDLEVKFILHKADQDFDKKLTDIPILSKDYYERGLNGGTQLFQNIKPLGYGPFQLAGNTRMQYILATQPHYIFGRAFLDGISFNFFQNEQTLLDNFIQEKVDLMEVRDMVTAQRLHQILGNEIKIFSIPRPEKKVYYLLFNTNRFPFTIPNVRNAIRLAVNSQDIVSRLVGQKGHVAYTLIDYTNPMFFKDVFKDNYSPNISLEMLENSGWKIEQKLGILQKDGKQMSFELAFEKDSYLEESIARSIKIHLAEVGINVQPRPVDYFQKKKMLESNSYSAIIGDYSYFDNDIYNALKDYYTKVLKGNLSAINYQNPTIDKLFSRADRDKSIRKQVIQRFQVYLRQDSPAVFLFFDDKVIYAVNQRFRDIRTPFRSSSGFYYRLNPFEDWYVPKSLQRY